MNTSRFVAHRRGAAVIVRGKVEVSAFTSGPYLLRMPSARADTLEFRRAYERQKFTTSNYATTLTLLVHHEPDVSEHVRYLRIVLPNNEAVVIESCR